MKPYNNFCVDNLHVGVYRAPSAPSTGLTSFTVEEKFQMKTFLQLHGLDFAAFDALVQGRFPRRPFIPLTSQVLKGKVVAVRTEAGGSSSVKIKCSSLLDALDAPSERVFVFGHWMGKADLRYVLEEGGTFKIIDRDHRRQKPIHF